MVIDFQRYDSHWINIAGIDFGYKGGVAPEPKYKGLKFIAVDEPCTIGYIASEYYTRHNKYLQASTDDGNTWSEWINDITIQPGEVLCVKGTDNYVWSSKRSKPTFTTSANVKCCGNIQSLCNDSEVIATTGCYYMLFKDTKITSTPELPATTLKQSCYGYMFANCVNITETPDLPAETIAGYAYEYMFSGCTRLKKINDFKATNLASFCFQYTFDSCGMLEDLPDDFLSSANNFGYSSCCTYMFNNCYNLKKVPSIVVTSVKSNAFYKTFYGCKNITDASNMILNASSTNSYCNTFEDCTALEKSPMIIVEDSKSGSFTKMFYNCSSLNEIYFMADADEQYYTVDWCYGVSNSGVFHKNPAKTWSITGPSGVPENWTVVYD